MTSLPTGWSKTNLGSLAAAIQYGYTASASKAGDGPRFLRITDIQEDSVDWGSVPTCEISRGRAQRYLLEGGDIVFARTGATTGKTYLVRDPPTAVFASYLIRLRLKAGIHPRFVWYFFQSTDYWRQIASKKKGIGQPNVNGSVLASLSIPVASTEEQVRVGDSLDAFFSALGASVETLRSQRAKLAAYRAAVLRAACEGRLVPTEAELARADAKSEDMEIRGSGTLTSLRLWAIPADWSWATLGEVSEGALHGPALSSSKYDERGTTVIRISDIAPAGEIRLRNPPKMVIPHNQLEKLLLQPGDILVARDASIGRCGLYESPDPAIFPNHLIRIRLRHSRVNPRYVHYYLLSPIGQEMLHRGASAGAGRASLKGQTLASFPIPVPPLDQQEMIVAEVERHLSGMQVLAAAIDANLARATRLRQAILKRAFEGRLVPQDPTDEPAGVLLEGIRKEREAAGVTKRARVRPSR